MSIPIEALGISGVALMISVLTLWLTKLRGPVLRPVEERERRSINVKFDIKTPHQLEYLHFKISTTIANHGGSAGMLRAPKIFLKKSLDLEDKPITVSISLVQVKPSEGDQGSYLEEGMTTDVTAQSAKTILLDCRLDLLTWDRRPPITQFGGQLTLREVWTEDFEAHKKEALSLLSIINQTNNIGTVNGEFTVTEKSVPIVGSISWKKRELFSRLKLEPDKKGLASSREKAVSWTLDSSEPLNLYNNLFHYVDEQGGAIRKNLKELSDSQSAFPVNDDEDKTYAANTLSMIYPNFDREWKRLSSYEDVYDHIIIWLKGRKYGRELSKKERDIISGLSRSLADILSLVKTLRNDVIGEFAES